MIDRLQTLCSKSTMSSTEALLPLSWSQSLIEHKHNTKAGPFLQDIDKLTLVLPSPGWNYPSSVLQSETLPTQLPPFLCPSPDQTYAGSDGSPLPPRILLCSSCRHFPSKSFTGLIPSWPLLLTGPGSNTCDCHRPPAARSLSNPTTGEYFLASGAEEGSWPVNPGRVSWSRRRWTYLMELKRLALSRSQTPGSPGKTIGSSSFPDLYFRGFLALFLLYFYIKVIFEDLYRSDLHGNKWEYHYCQKFSSIISQGFCFFTFHPHTG